MDYLDQFVQGFQNLRILRLLTSVLAAQLLESGRQVQLGGNKLPGPQGVFGSIRVHVGILGGKTVGVALAVQY